VFVVEVYVKCYFCFWRSRGKIEETHLRLQLANLSQCLLLDNNALRVNPSLIQKDYRGAQLYTVTHDFFFFLSYTRFNNDRVKKPSTFVRRGNKGLVKYII